VYINRIVAGISFNLQRLYNFGLRDVMVSNLLRPGCTPYYSKKYNYTMCDTSLDSIAQIHNGLLLSAVEKINAQNPGARFIILDQHAAFGQIYTQAKAAGMSKIGVAPTAWTQILSTSSRNSVQEEILSVTASTQYNRAQVHMIIKPGIVGHSVRNFFCAGR
jgi:hypothetical protein